MKLQNTPFNYDSAAMIDVREYPEFAAGHIEGSQWVPLGAISATSALWNRGEPLTLICKSGKRAEQARQLLAACGFTSLSVLKGGVDEWQAAGRPLVSVVRPPWSMERQVRITAGSLVLLTLALAYLISPLFVTGTAFIGAGLVFAGVSDTCMMGSLLAKLPWNRPSRSLA